MADGGALRPYRVLLGSRLRSQLSYRSSFVTLLAASAAVAVVEFVELYAVLSNTKVLGGLTLAQASVVFALANLGFALATVVFGQLDSIPTLLRMGQLESLLVRPIPLMAQLITSDFELRRIGRALLSLVILALALQFAGVDWSVRSVLIVLLAPVFGAAIYGGLFAVAGGVQFFVIDGAELTSSFLYGSSYAGQLPGSVLSAPLRLVFTFVAPATVTGYLPTLLLLRLPGPTLLPAELGWFAPLFAVSTWLLAGLTWRAGIRHFTGAGG